MPSLWQKLCFQTHSRGEAPLMTLKCDGHTWRVALNLQTTFSCHTALSGSFIPGGSRSSKGQFSYNPCHPKLSTQPQQLCLPTPIHQPLEDSSTSPLAAVSILALSAERGRLRGEGYSQAARGA